MDTLKNKLYPTNPLGIIALFVFLIEAISTASLNILVDAQSSYVGPLVYFIIGFPSAIAMLFFITLWSKREALFAPSDFRDEDNFLKLFQSRLSSLNKTVERKAQQLDPNSGEARQLRDVGESILLTRAFTVANDDSPTASELTSVIRDLDTHLSVSPTSGTVAIMLGRLYRMTGELNAAIDSLTRYLQANSATGREKTKYYSTVFYNRACYRVLAAVASGDPKLKDAALEDLKASIELDSRYKDNAQIDPDFEAIRTDPRFLSLVSPTPSSAP